MAIYDNVRKARQEINNLHTDLVRIELFDARLQGMAVAERVERVART